MHKCSCGINYLSMKGMIDCEINNHGKWLRKDQIQKEVAKALAKERGRVGGIVKTLNWSYPYHAQRQAGFDDAIRAVLAALRGRKGK